MVNCGGGVVVIQVEIETSQWPSAIIRNIPFDQTAVVFDKPSDSHRRGRVVVQHSNAGLTVRCREALKRGEEVDEEKKYIKVRSIAM